MSPSPILASHITSRFRYPLPSLSLHSAPRTQQRGKAPRGVSASEGLGAPLGARMRIRELRRGAGGLEVEDDEDEPWEVVRGADGEVVSVERRNANHALVGAGARFLFYPTLLYNVIRNELEPEFHWWDLIDEYVLLGAVPFCSDVPRLKQLGVRGVVTLNEPYETVVPKSLYQAHGISHLEIPTRDYLFAPSMENICKAVDFIHQNELQCGITYVHCKAGRGRSTTVVLCYLVKYRNMTPKAALDHARFVRPRVKLAKAQWQACNLTSSAIVFYLNGC